jgi:hypothetical protein
MERRAEHQKLCRKSKCRNAFNRGLDLGRYHTSSIPSSTHEKPIKPGIKTCLADGRPWRIIAGPPPTPSQFHCATVPDGPDCQWEGGEYRRVEAKNRELLKAAEQTEIEANGDFAELEWREVISPDGVRCFATRYATVASAPIMSSPIVGGGLDIPNFLKREISRPCDRPQENGSASCTTSSRSSFDR